jgi:hypothetical protein
MSAGTSIELNMKLLRAYTFDECSFDFTDPRTERPIAFFGDAEFTQNITVSVGVTEEHSRAVEYRREFEEKVTVSESHKMKQALFSVFEEQLSLAESTPPALVSVFVEGIELSNPRTPMLETRTERKLSITEKRTNQIFREHTSGFAVQEKHSREFRAQRTFVERIPLCVTYGVRIEQTHIERFGIRGEIIPAPRSEFTERISIYDGVLRACDGSLSGVVVGNGMTLDEFKRRVMRPVGYETFRPFHVGDYEYEKALVRIFITVGSFGAIPEIYDVVMNVDIDDTVDRGTMRMKAEETVVPFNKHYYTKPEVTVALLSGNTADGVVLPEITMIGTESFTCVLRKRDGSAAAGTISWTAVGY